MKGTFAQVSIGFEPIRALFRRKDTHYFVTPAQIAKYFLESSIKKDVPYRQWVHAVAVLTSSRLQPLGIVGASSTLHSLLQCCSVAVPKTIVWRSRLNSIFIYKYRNIFGCLKGKIELQQLQHCNKCQPMSVQKKDGWMMFIFAVLFVDRNLNVVPLHREKKEDPPPTPPVREGRQVLEKQRARAKGHGALSE